MGTIEHRSITQIVILRMVSVSIFKIVSNFKEANKKFVIVKERENWKACERNLKPSAHTQKVPYWLKSLDLQNHYPSLDTVPLTKAMTKFNNPGRSRERKDLAQRRMASSSQSINIRSYCICFASTRYLWYVHTPHCLTSAKKETIRVL